MALLIGEGPVILDWTKSTPLLRGHIGVIIELGEFVEPCLASAHVALIHAHLTLILASEPKGEVRLVVLVALVHSLPIADGPPEVRGAVACLLYLKMIMWCFAIHHWQISRSTKAHFYYFSGNRFVQFLKFKI